MTPLGPKPTPITRRELLGTAAAFAVLALAFMAPLFRHIDNWCIEDWDQHLFYHEAVRVSVLQYHQVPLWNPWYCGGADLLANPQNRALAPTFLLDLVLGSVRGLKLEFWLHAVVGMLGLYLLARRQGLSRPASWIAPSTIFLGSLYALPVSTGMSWVTSLAFMPWCVLAFVESFRDMRFLLGAGAALALMNFAGGAYVAVITCTFLSVYSLFRAGEAGLRAAMIRLVGAVGASVALGAAKLLPAIEMMHAHPRRMEQLSGLSIESLLIGLFSLDQRLQVAYTHLNGIHFDPVKDGPTFGLLHGIATEFDDVGMYVGPLGGLLVLVGLGVAFRQRLGLGLLLVGFFWLSLGDRLRFNPLHLLHRLPVFESMRYAERYRFIWFPCAMLFAGLGLDWICARLDARFSLRRPGRVVAVLVVAAELADLLRVVTPVYAIACPIAPPTNLERGDFKQVTALPSFNARGPLTPDASTLDIIYGTFSAHLPALLRNLGAVECYETAVVPRDAVPSTSPDYRGEVSLQGVPGTVSTLLWSPNRLRYTVQAQGPGRLVINQNYYSGWHATDGRPVREVGGLLAVDVAATDSTIELTYRPWTFLVGLLVSALAWLGLAGLWWRTRTGVTGPA